MKIKKILLMALLIFGILLSYDSVIASNGPKKDDAYIIFFKDDDFKYVYDDGDIDNGVLPGATYDKDSNTLTISNVKGYSLSTENMGDDFKLKVDGDNELNDVDISAYHYPAGIHITGYGNLIINKEKNTIFGLDIYWGSIVIDDTVNIDIDVIESISSDPDYVPSVMYVVTENENPKDAIVLKNGDNLDFSSERYCYYNQDFFHAIMLGESVADFTGLIAEKDNRKYFVDKIEEDDFYYVYYGDIKSLTYNGTKYYYLDESSIEYGDDKFERIGSTEDFENAGYVITDENYDVRKATYTTFARAYDANEETVYAIYSPDTNNESVNDITDVKVTLDNGVEYTLVIPNNNVSLDSFHYKKVCTGWIHEVPVDSIKIKAKRYQVIEGNDQTYVIGDDSLSFTINADYNLFANGGKVYIDDEEITDYTSKEGSTIITISGRYIEKLSNGNHSLLVTFNNGKYASANFTVKDNTSEVNEDVAENQNSSNEIKTPETNDNIVLYLELFGISILGMYLLKKYEKNLN